MNSDSVPGGSQPPWQPGDCLTVRGHEWTVVQSTTYPDCEALRVEAIADARRQTFLLPFDRPCRMETRRLAVVHLRRWLPAFERLLLDAYPHGGLRCCPASIDLIPYQLEPTLAMVRDGHPRMLIADDVGLGKTIEASLILAELAGRDEGIRALVVVPAGLRQQWGDELARRFTRDVIAADASWLRALAHWLPADVNPWSLPGVYVSSYDFVKQPEALRPIEDVRWDLVIVDEAHAATMSTDRRAALDAIASRARRVILLTATPPADAAQFDALCRIGAETSDVPVVMFQRTRERELGASARRSVVLATRTTEEERRMHRTLERYTTLVWREAGSRGDTQGRLASVILRKRALSSAASLELSVRRRQELLAGLGPPPELQLLLPLDEDDGREDVISDAVLGSPGLCDLAAEQRWLKGVLMAAEAASHQESKARLLVRLLSRIRQPAIVFTEYRDTLERLLAVLLKANLPTRVLHGGLSAPERRDVVANFARGDVTLLATDAAAEGLNLHSACRVIVHYELPWNPSRMLQRAGRVDRIGQTRRVHEIALVASDTAESLVLAPLARRATGRLTAGGSGRMLELLTESRVAEAVFEGVPPDSPKQPAADVPRLLFDLTADGIAEARRLRKRRALMATARAAASERSQGAIAVAVLPRSSLNAGMVLLFDLKTTASSKEVVERVPVAIHVALALPLWPRRPAHIKRRVTEILPGLLAAVSPVLDDLGRRQLDSVRPRYLAAFTRSQQREQEILKRHQSAARQLVQAGLFDRRALHAAARHREAPRGAEWGDGAPTSDELGGVQGSPPFKRGAERGVGAPASDEPGEGSSQLSSSADLRAILVVRRR